LLTVTMVIVAYFICRIIVASRLGRVLVAVRDKETRLYFAGYKPYAFKVFAFAVGAMLGGIGGMLYSPQVGIITPQNMSVETSILMVIWVALGGRGRLWGAIFGALLVNVTLSSISSDLPSFWLYVEGGMFLLVVLLFPDGFVKLWDEVERQAAQGAGAVRVFVAILPLLIVSLFVLGESLSLTPAILRSSIYQTSKGDQLEYKYILLIASLVGTAIWSKALKSKSSRVRGFPVLTTQSATTKA
ncbi:MAG TPA: hypothetical protein VKK61_00870, partial [Tepidisphaeraceae bacterium]|nr:hypothetical protein [Tepidisphaeraceae bacterium]